MSRIEVHQLAEKLKLKDNLKVSDPDEQSLINTTSALYNNSSVRFERTLLGSKSFRPRPKGVDSITIKLTNSLGESLFNLVKDNDQVITTQDKFDDYFKGIALIAGQGTGNNVLNFKASRTSVQVYYSEETDQGNREAKSIDFNLTNSALQFNGITGNRTGTAIESIIRKKPLTYTATGNRCFVQSGIGLVTKVKFPFILEWLNEKVNAINQATLIIEIPKDANNVFDPPAVLNLFVANKRNKPQSTINNFYGEGDQAAILQKNYDGDIQGKMRYVFNITQFLNNLRKTANNADLSLLISVPLSTLPTSVERVVLGSPGSPQAKIKLKIKYTKYQIPD
jgi:hypothetical protein